MALVHQTTVKLDVAELVAAASVLRRKWIEVGGSKEGPARSEYLAYNRVDRFLAQRAMDIEAGGQFEMDTFGSDSPATARVTYKPSLTSMPKEFRKAIVPRKAGNVFLYLDLKAAEFALACHFAGMKGVLAKYQGGTDVYDLVSNAVGLQGLSHAVAKRIMMGWLYGMSANRMALELEITSSQAQAAVRDLNTKVEPIVRLKKWIKQITRKHNFYLYPEDAKATTFGRIEIQDFYKETRAYSVFFQSGLGALMQKCIKGLEEIQHNGNTILSVFDAILVEVAPDELEHVKNYISERFVPLWGEFKVGRSFYEAAYEGKPVILNKEL